LNFAARLAAVFERFLGALRFAVFLAAGFRLVEDLRLTLDFRLTVVLRLTLDLRLEVFFFELFFLRTAMFIFLVS